MIVDSRVLNLYELVLEDLLQFFKFKFDDDILSCSTTWALFDHNRNVTYFWLDISLLPKDIGCKTMWFDWIW